MIHVFLLFIYIMQIMYDIHHPDITIVIPANRQDYNPMLT